MQNIYVMSDIHACETAFLKILNKIKFTSDDLLIIAGDLIDRGGKNNLSLINFVKNKDNIILIRGNHEEFFIRYDNNELSRRDYYNFGGQNTLFEVEHSKIEDYLSFRNYIIKTPLYYEIEVNNKNYFICHNGFNLDLPIIESNNIIDIKNTIDIQYKADWFNFFVANDLYYGVNNFDKYIIAGHTPTGNLGNKNNILINRKYIDLDCGATYNGGKLGCLRLNDFKIFYENISKTDLT